MSLSPRHQCLIYSGAPSEQIGAIGTILIDRLNAGYRCLYLNSPTMVSGLRSYLASKGVDLKERIASGALVLSSDQNHLVNGRFEIEPMIGILRTAALVSETDGYVGLWVSGDMTWEFGGERNLKKLLEYECRLEQLFQECPELNGICQYHMDTLPGDAISTALHTHQGVFINEALTRINPHYVSPETILKDRTKAQNADLQKMLARAGLPPYPIKDEGAVE